VLQLPKTQAGTALLTVITPAPPFARYQNAKDRVLFRYAKAVPWTAKSPALLAAYLALRWFVRARPFLVRPRGGVYKSLEESPQAVEGVSMSSDDQSPRSDADAQLEREIREGRKFTLEEAVARMVGPGGMKGESPVARMQQAEIEIGSWLRTHLVDAGGVLEVVLHRRVKRSELLLRDFENPLSVLADYCQRVLDSEYVLAEVVRDADFEWGRLMGERPHFNKAGSEPHGDDPYTVESVRSTLSEILKQLAAERKPQA
jgi:hypothetical protein